jgi:hypothetical protein
LPAFARGFAIRPSFADEQRCVEVEEELVKKLAEEIQPLPSNDAPDPGRC